MVELTGRNGGISRDGAVNELSFGRLIYFSGFCFSGSRLSEILGCCGFGDLVSELCLGPGGCLFSFYC